MVSSPRRPRIFSAPCTSILITVSVPEAMALSTLAKVRPFNSPYTVDHSKNSSRSIIARKVASSTNQYETPSISPGAGGRVGYEGEPLPEHRVLADTARPGEDDQDAAIAHCSGLRRRSRAATSSGGSA